MNVVASKSIAISSPETKSSWIPEVIILGPGGIKGFSFLGALVVFEKYGYLDSVTTYGGVSVGSIISLLIIAGYKIKEIVTEAADTSLFQDISSISLNNIRAGGGLISNEPIKRKLSELLCKKLGKVPSMKQLYMATGLNYMSVTFNVDKDDVEYFTHETNPNISCVDAAMLSMNIPFLFYQLKYNNCTYIDGAFGNPYPIDYYDNGKRNILGLYVSSEEKERSNSSEGTFNYAHRAIQAPISQLRKNIISNCSLKCQHLKLYNTVSDISGISVSPQVKADMVNDGYKEAIQFILNLQKEDTIGINNDDDIVIQNQKNEYNNKSGDNSVDWNLPKDPDESEDYVNYVSLP